MVRLVRSFSYAIVGIVECLRGEKNMQIHWAAGLLVFILAVYLKLNRLEWGLLTITVFMVLVAEMINTAVEKTVDLITDSFHPLARLAKNTAAGAVLLAAMNAVIMAVIIFGPRVMNIK